MNWHAARGDDPSRPAIPDAILRSRVIAIGRRIDPATLPTVGEGLAAGGVRAFEVTLNSTGALTAIDTLARRFGPDELLVGAGTVLDLAAAEAAVDAGARFLVSPHTDPSLIGWAAGRGIPSFPGAFSPTEILVAWRAGAAAVKLFPASAVGPVFVREFRGPFPEIPLVPTGGVTVETAPVFIAAGAVAIGIGSWLIGDGDPAGIRARAERLVTMLGEARQMRTTGGIQPADDDRRSR